MSLTQAQTAAAAPAVHLEPSLARCQLWADVRQPLQLRGLARRPPECPSRACHAHRRPPCHRSTLWSPAAPTCHTTASRCLRARRTARPACACRCAPIAPDAAGGPTPSSRPSSRLTTTTSWGGHWLACRAPSCWVARASTCASWRVPLLLQTKPARELPTSGASNSLCSPCARWKRQTHQSREQREPCVQRLVLGSAQLPYACRPRSPGPTRPRRTGQPSAGAIDPAATLLAGATSAAALARQPHHRCRRRGLLCLHGATERPRHQQLARQS